MYIDKNMHGRQLQLIQPLLFKVKKVVRDLFGFVQYASAKQEENLSYL